MDTDTLLVTNSVVDPEPNKKPTAHTIDKDIEAQNKKEQEEKNTYEDIKRNLANFNNEQQMEYPQGNDKVVGAANDVGREVS